MTSTLELQPWKLEPRGAEVTIRLRRVRSLDRLVRYEREITYRALVPCRTVTEYGPAFYATLQEWERAAD